MNEQVLLISSLKFLGKGPYDFSLSAHDCVGLSGRSGVGKTQLLKAIVDLIPFEGEIFCQGKLFSDIPAPLWRTMITLVLAESFWWYDTVGEHFPATGASQAEVLGLLERLGFGPEVLDWSIVNLSTGERQRLSLLRSLLNKPVVLLLDEPTSSLDQYHTEMVEDFIQDYSKKNRVAVIWVSHDTQQLDRVTSRKFQMQENSLIEIK